MIAPKRITIKLFVDNSQSIVPGQVIAIFQRWIQDSQVEGLLIDVADYQHVHRGPGIILIGHEGDYAYDLGDNRPGIQYTLKQTTGFSLKEAVAIALRRVLQATNHFENETSLGNVRINSHQLEITFRDRLNFPNHAETIEKITPELQAILSDNYLTHVVIERIQVDGNDLLRLRIESATDITSATSPNSVVAEV